MPLVTDDIRRYLLRDLRTPSFRILSVVVDPEVVCLLDLCCEQKRDPLLNNCVGISCAGGRDASQLKNFY